MSESESKSVVLAALLANVAIGALKFGAFLATGSAAMLAEVYHSVSDNGNQILLLVGLSRSAKAPTRTHPFGHGKAQFFYGFLVSVLLFGIAGWRSVSKGYHALTHLDAVSTTASATALGGIVPGIAVAYGVLGGVIVIEGWSWRKAHRTLTDEIAAHSWNGYSGAFRHASDTTTLTTFIEDSIAVTGAGVALVGITLSQVTGNPVFDAAAAFGIGVMLILGAFAVAWTNKRLLIGKSLPPAEERQLVGALAEYETVAEIAEFRTVYFGPDTVHVTARVAFVGGLDTSEVSDTVAAIKADLADTHTSVSSIYISPERSESSTDTTSDDTPDERRASVV